MELFARLNAKKRCVFFCVHFRKMMRFVFVLDDFQDIIHTEFMFDILLQNAKEV